jgi:hypothetical protein
MSRPSLPRLAATAGLASLLLVAAACGDSDDDTAATTTSTTAPVETTSTSTAPEDTTTTEGSADPADACTLLTAEDASEALGEDAVPGFTQEADLCVWSDAAELRTVQLALLDETPDEWRAGRRAGDFEPVDGVGEEAYFGPVFDDLSFLVGDQVYEVDVELRGDGDGLEVATALAETVISRL